MNTTQLCKALTGTGDHDTRDSEGWMVHQPHLDEPCALVGSFCVNAKRLLREKTNKTRHMIGGILLTLGRPPEVMEGNDLNMGRTMPPSRGTQTLTW